MTQGPDDEPRDPAAIRLLQACAMMESGIRLKRASLRHHHPEETDAEIEERLHRWLARED